MPLYKKLLECVIFWSVCRRGRKCSPRELFLSLVINAGTRSAAAFKNAILRIATEIIVLAGLTNQPPPVLRQQFYGFAMRLLVRLVYERLFGPSWSSYFVHIPYADYSMHERWVGLLDFTAKQTVHTKHVIERKAIPGYS